MSRDGITGGGINGLFIAWQFSYQDIGLEFSGFRLVVTFKSEKKNLFFAN